MAAPKHSKTGDWRNIMDKVHTSLSNGTTNKLFEEDYFVLDLIKLLYEENLETYVKVEILTVIEQWGSGVLPVNSIDQAITALLDVFRDLDSSPTSLTLAVQLLLTVTTLFIENEELMDTELCTTYLTVLTNLVTKVNNVNTRRVRACSCHCLAQMESWKPGLLWRSRDTFAKLVREESTDVCQDYMQLLITVTLNTDQLENVEQASLKAEAGKKAAQIAMTASGKDVLSTVSLIMDNSFLLTPAGILSVACSVVRLVKGHKDIHPDVFKPLMLQCLSSMDPCVIFMMLFLQKEFRRETLSDGEESLLLKRAVECVNHPSTGCNTRLLILEWLLSYLQRVLRSLPQHDQNGLIMGTNPISPSVIQDIRGTFDKVDLESNLPQLKNALFPVVFDPLDVHTRKLSLLVCSSSSYSQKELSSDLHYLTQVAVTTGGMRIATALYHVLYRHVQYNNCDTVHEYVLRITRQLFKNFAHLIPLIVDFLRAVRTRQPHSKLHSEMLVLLHETVLSLPISSLLSSYQNYLHVWILSAQDSSIQQQKPLRRMLEIVQEAVMKALDDWDLGCLILSVCRTMMLHHHTDILYSQIGDLLCFLMKEYGDSDIRDQARLFYALLTLNSDTKVKEILGAVIESLHLGGNIADFFPGSIIQTAPAEINLLSASPIIWSREQLEIVFDSNGDRNDCSFPHPVKDGLENYWEQLLGLQTSLRCTLKVTITTDSDSDNLLAVSFHASENKKWHFSPDANLPFLSKGANSTVSYTLTPHIPEPVVITARAVFGFDKSTYECELTPLKLELQDFLIPFPWHEFEILDKQQFFNLHWNNYTQKSRGKSTGVESVKILKCGRHSLVEVWGKALITNGERKDTDDYLFFLPPRFHLLFHILPRATDLVVQIASDYWPVLGFLDVYLDSLV